ncbi:MAG: hypothetical protein ACYSU1_06405 [Planctomycetota bacterium]|jgi:hypothetical protein
MRILPILPILLVGILAGLFLNSGSQALVPQPAASIQAQGDLPQFALAREPHWNSINVEDDTPTMLLRVPAGRRFVLTDMWFLSREEQFLPIQDGDRVWLESQNGTTRNVVFDSPILELDLPLRWQTGVSFSDGQEMWVNYRTKGKTDLLRRVHFSGYFEPIFDGNRR